MLKYEVDFGFDNFSKPKILSKKDTIAQLIKNLLFLAPGQLPSLPHIGINISKYIYKLTDSIDIDALKEDIGNQCSALLPYIEIRNVSVQVINYNNQDVMMIVIPVNIEGEDETLLMGIKKNSSGRIIFKYEFEESNTQ